MELRLQALRAKIVDLDFVLITHTHADHIFGIDDLRPFTQTRSLSVFASPEHAADLRSRFSYAFGGPVLQVGGGLPLLELTSIDSTFEIDSIRFDPIPFDRGDTFSFGYRFGNFAYLTDGNLLSPESYAKLTGVELLVLNAVSPGRSKTHFSFETACDAIERIRPRRAWFTHLSHRVPCVAAEAWIAEAVAKRPGLADIEIHPGCDGLVIDGITV
jgi:phosphoribosyl 1,2-cyclic phosphate phosphodiesterase